MAQNSVTLKSITREFDVILNDKGYRVTEYVDNLFPFDKNTKIFDDEANAINDPDLEDEILDLIESGY